jgi:hypothetical protein
MSRIRLLLLGLLAVVAVSAAASASASAETCTGGSHFVFCNDNQEPLTGAAVLGLGGLALLAGHLGGVEAKFDCSDVHFSATLEKLGSGKGLLQFLNCKEEKPAKCKLSTAQEKEIDAKFNVQQNSVTLATFTGSGTGELFTELVVENKGAEVCAVPGVYPVTKRQIVSTPKGGSSLVNQEIIATKANSELTLGSESASFSSTTNNAMLSSGLAWLVMAGE